MGNGVICGPFSRLQHANNKMRSERGKKRASKYSQSGGERETLFAWYKCLSACHFHIPSPGNAHSAKNNVSLTRERERDVVGRRALHIFFGHITMRNLAYSLACSTPITEARVCNKNIKELPRMQPVFQRRAGRKRREMRMPTSAFSISAVKI